MPSEHHDNAPPYHLLHNLNNLLQNRAPTEAILEELAKLHRSFEYAFVWMNDNLYGDHELGQRLKEFFGNLTPPVQGTYERYIEKVFEKQNVPSIDAFNAWVQNQNTKRDANHSKAYYLGVSLNNDTKVRELVNNAFTKLSADGSVHVAPPPTPTPVLQPDAAVAASFPTQAAAGAAVSANNWFGHSTSTTNASIHTPAHRRSFDIASTTSNSSFFSTANGSSHFGSGITRTPSQSNHPLRTPSKPNGIHHNFFTTPRQTKTPYYGDEENRQNYSSRKHIDLDLHSVTSSLGGTSIGAGSFSVNNAQNFVDIAILNDTNKVMLDPHQFKQTLRKATKNNEDRLKTIYKIEQANNFKGATAFQAAVQGSKSQYLDKERNAMHQVELLRKEMKYTSDGGNQFAAAQQEEAKLRQAKLLADFENDKVSLENKHKREVAELTARYEDDCAKIEQDVASNITYSNLESKHQTTNYGRELDDALEHARKVKEEKEEKLTLPAAMAECLQRAFEVSNEYLALYEGGAQTTNGLAMNGEVDEKRRAKVEAKLKKLASLQNAIEEKNLTLLKLLVWGNTGDGNEMASSPTPSL